MNANLSTRPFPRKGMRIGGGRFLITGMIGRGGEGRVYAAQDSDNSNEEVAIKFWDGDKGEKFNSTYLRSQKWFRHEAELLRIHSAKNGGLPRYVYDGEYEYRELQTQKDGKPKRGKNGQPLFLTVGRPYFVMEKLEKPSSFPSSDKDVASFLLKICDTLQYLHERNIYHKDIKPSNIRIRSSTGDPILIDFGIAQDGSPCSHTQRELRRYFNRVSSGTSGFGAPEQFSSTPQITAATDIFAVGNLINLFFANDEQFYAPQGEVEGALKNKGLFERVVPESCVPPQWLMIESKCRSMKPFDRYPNVIELSAAIRERFERFRMYTEISHQADVEGDWTELDGVYGRSIDEVEWEDELKPSLVHPEVYVDGMLIEDPEYSPAYRIELAGRRLMVHSKATVSPGVVIEIVGPGVLDAEIELGPGAVVSLGGRVVFHNRAKMGTETVSSAYVLSDRSYLNFTQMEDGTHNGKPQKIFMSLKGGSILRYRGPCTIEEVYQLQKEEIERVLNGKKSPIILHEDYSELPSTDDEIIEWEGLEKEYGISEKIDPSGNRIYVAQVYMQGEIDPKSIAQFKTREECEKYIERVRMLD